MKIYVASSWRNLLQPGIVRILRGCGHDVYDFRNPAPGDRGFGWDQIDPRWQNWTPEEFERALEHPIAVAGWEHDMRALNEAAAVVLVMPAGRSASWEFGYAMARGAKPFIVAFDRFEPELMWRGARVLTSPDAVFDAFGGPTT